MKRLKLPVNIILGICIEVAYALAIILTAFLICLMFYFKR